MDLFYRSLFTYVCLFWHALYTSSPTAPYTTSNESPHVYWWITRFDEAASACVLVCVSVSVAGRAQRLRLKRAFIRLCSVWHSTLTCVNNNMSTMSTKICQHNISTKMCPSKCVNQNVSKRTCQKEWQKGFPKKYVQKDVYKKTCRQKYFNTHIALHVVVAKNIRNKWQQNPVYCTKKFQKKC